MKQGKPRGRCCRKPFHRLDEDGIFLLKQPLGERLPDPGACGMLQKTGSMPAEGNSNIFKRGKGICRFRLEPVRIRGASAVHENETAMVPQV